MARMPACNKSRTTCCDARSAGISNSGHYCFSTGSDIQRFPCGSGRIPLRPSIAFNGRYAEQKGADGRPLADGMRTLLAFDSVEPAIRRGGSGERTGG